jgi:hypothetical protein
MLPLYHKLSVRLDLEAAEHGKLKSSRSLVKMKNVKVGGLIALIDIAETPRTSEGLAYLMSTQTRVLVMRDAGTKVQLPSQSWPMELNNLQKQCLWKSTEAIRNAAVNLSSQIDYHAYYASEPATLLLPTSRNIPHVCESVRETS